MSNTKKIPYEVEFLFTALFATVLYACIPRPIEVDLMMMEMERQQKEKKKSPKDNIPPISDAATGPFVCFVGSYKELKKEVKRAKKRYDKSERFEDLTVYHDLSRELKRQKRTKKENKL